MVAYHQRISHYGYAAVHVGQKKLLLALIYGEGAQFNVCPVPILSMVCLMNEFILFGQALNIGAHLTKNIIVTILRDE